MESKFKTIKFSGDRPTKNTEKKQNTRYSSRYKKSNFLILNLYEQFQRPVNIWFLLICVLRLAIFGIDFEGFFYLGILGVFLVFRGGLDYWIFYELNLEDEKHNKLKYDVWRDFEIKTVKLENINDGDVIFLKEGQKAPVDLVLLGTLDEGELVTVEKPGTKNTLTKYPIKVTHQYINSLGVYNLSVIAKIKDSFDEKRCLGTLKLEFDPKASQVSKRNVIERDEVLNKHDKVLTMAIFVGEESNEFHKMKELNKKPNRFEKVLNEWILFSLVLIFVLVVVSVTLEYNFDTLAEWEDFIEILVNVIVLYSLIIPAPFIFILDLTRTIQCIYFQRTQRKHVKFRTFDLIDELGQVSYITTEIDTLISEEHSQIKAIFTNNNLYSEEIHQKKKKKMDILGISVIDEETSNISVKASFNSNTFHLEEISERIFQKSLEQYTLIGMALANQVTIQDERYISEYQDEVSMTQKAKDLKMELKTRSKTRCSFLIENEETVSFRILGSLLENSCSFIVVESDETILLAMGTLDNLKSMVHSDLEEDWLFFDNQDLDFISSGLRTYTIGYKILTKVESLTFKQKQLNVGVSLFELNNSSSFQELRQKLAPLAIIGLQDTFYEEDVKTLKELREVGISLFGVSENSESRLISAAETSGMFLEATPIFRLIGIEGTEECFKQLVDTVESSLRCDELEEGARISKIELKNKKPKVSTHEEISNLDKLLHNMSLSNGKAMFNYENNLALHPLFKNKSEVLKAETVLDFVLNLKYINFELSVDRASFLIALNDPECKKLMTCLIFASKAAFFSEFQSDDKASLVRLLKENLEFEPTVMALGSSVDDIAMVEEANIGVCVGNEIGNFSEIELEEFSLLKRLLIVHGENSYTMMVKIAHLLFYESYLLVGLEFLYIFINGYSGTDLYEYPLKLGYLFLFYSVPLIWISVKNLFDNKKAGAEQKISYKRGMQQTGLEMKGMLKFSLFFAVIHSLLIFLSTFFKFQVLNADGMTENRIVLQISAYIKMILVFLVQIGFYTEEDKKTNFAYFLVSIVFMGVFLTIVDSVQGELQNFSRFLQESPFQILTIFMTVLIAFTLNLLIILITKKPPIKKYSILQEFPFVWLPKYTSEIIKVFKNSMDSFEDLKKNIYDINKKTLRFCEPSMKSLYEFNFIKHNLRSYQRTFIILLIIFLVWIIFDYISYNSTINSLIFRVLICSWIFSVVSLSFSKTFTLHYRKLIIATTIISILLKFTKEMIFSEIYPLIEVLIPCVVNTMLNFDFVYIFIGTSFSFLLFLITLTNYAITTEDLKASDIFFYFLYVFSISLNGLVIGYGIKYRETEEFILEHSLEQDMAKSEQILQYLIPKFVKDRVKQGIRYIADEQGTVTILFCDICDFDKLCNHYESDLLIEFLNLLFQKFDILCELIGVTKIETVGKTYMACAGLAESEKLLDERLTEVNHARRAVELGLQIISSITDLMLVNGKPVKVKIGIHSGEVVAGVVGTHKPEFSLIGDTVNTASRMCSTLKSPNSIEISETTKDMIGEEDHNLYFVPRTIEAKGKGTLNTYLISEKAEEEDVMCFWLFAEGEKQIEHEKKRSTDFLNEKHNKREVFKSDSGMRVNLFCLDKELEKKEWKRKMEQEKYSILIAIIIVFITTLAEDIADTYYYSTGEYEVSLFIILFEWIDIFSLIVIIIFLNKIYLKRFFPYLLQSLLIKIFIIRVAQIYYEIDKPIELITMEIMLIVTYCIFITGSTIYFIIISQILIWTIYVSIVSLNDDIIQTIGFSAILFSFIVLNIVSFYYSETSFYKSYSRNYQNELEFLNTEKLLVNLLPKWVLPELYDDLNITDRFHEVTILYADIAGFTSWSSSRVPSEVVKMLSKMFTKFDELCLVEEVYKVHTIGDCYVVIGIIDKNWRDPIKECENVIKMAFSMIRAVEELEEIGLEMRIGIHTGELIGGVTGTKAVRYDIYGPDVLFANKIESEGVPGNVCVSESTLGLMGERFGFQEHKVLKTSTGEYVETYLVEYGG